MPSPELAVADVRAWEALDSRGNPTVACRVALAGGATGRAIVPAGASRGRHEAPEWRDAGPRMGGLGVRGAIETIETRIRPALVGTATDHPAVVDRILSSIGPQPGRGPIGANTTLAVSVAAARAGAAGRAMPLWRHLGGGPPPVLPMPMIQILGGGAHAGRTIDIQDVLVVPVAAASFGDAIEMVWRVRAAACARAERLGHNTRLVPDEGGLAIPFTSNRRALEFVAAAIDDARLGGAAEIAIDVAASQLIDERGRYALKVEGRALDRDAWLRELEGWATDLPLWSMEDPIDEDDWEGWREAQKRLGVAQLVGDDLFATDPARIRHGASLGAANAVLIKPNQRGTLSEAAEAVREAAAAQMRTIVSARSGDTEDDWLADLAVGWHAGQIKVGSLSRSERTAKWNRLLELEALEPSARLARPTSTPEDP